jgi:hypothetical protein
VVVWWCGGCGCVVVVAEMVIVVVAVVLVAVGIFNCGCVDCDDGRRLLIVLMVGDGLIVSIVGGYYDVTTTATRSQNSKSICTSQQAGKESSRAS